jgi:membrane protein
MSACGRGPTTTGPIRSRTSCAGSSASADSRAQRGGEGRRHSGFERGARGLWDDLRDRAREHHLVAFSSAVAFRALVALIPLVLLGLGLLGAFGLQEVWRDSLAPHIRGRVTPPVYRAVEYSVEKILHSGTFWLIALALVLTIWNLAVAVRTTMDALNILHDVEEGRSRLRRSALALVLAVAVGACLVGSALVVLAAPRAGGGALDVVLGIGRWIVALALSSLAVGLLVRYAPAEPPQASWASVGSVLVVLVWAVASLLFRIWATDVANFKTAEGSLLWLLGLTTYIFVSSSIFLVGVELDELLREETDGEPYRALELARALRR